MNALDVGLRGLPLPLALVQARNQRHATDRIFGSLPQNLESHSNVCRASAVRRRTARELLRCARHIGLFAARSSQAD